MSSRSSTAMKKRSSASRKSGGTRARKRYSKPMPPEGENGLFSQDWFAICLSDEVERGQCIGREFLGGHVVVFRGEDGSAHVVSGYCPHLGTDLALGKVVGNALECRFHKWQFDGEGTCLKTGIGDPPPPGACLFKFPTRDRWGLIWAFNGEEPLWHLPDPKYPDDELYVSAMYGYEFDADPWVFAANTYDFVHFKLLHGLELLGGPPDPDKDIEWSKYHVKYNVRVRHWGNKLVESVYGTYGTNIFYYEGEYDGRWCADLAPRGLIGPGRSNIHLTIMTQKGSGSAKEIKSAAAFCKRMMKMEDTFAQQDREILKTIRFRQGYLTKSDRALAKFLDYIRRYPRAHPSAEFIS